MVRAQRYRLTAIPGSEQTRPREAKVKRPPLAELGTAPVMRRGQKRAAVWVGCGATAGPREAEQSSRLAAVFWVCYNINTFKGSNDYDVTVLYNKDPASYCCIIRVHYCCIIRVRTALLLYHTYGKLKRLAIYANNSTTTAKYYCIAFGTAVVPYKTALRITAYHHRGLHEQ